MSDIKKTALIILIIALLSNTFTQYAYAANDYDHDELMQYEGYGKAMYDSVVEQATFITGQYTDNKDYVSQSIDQLKDYADFWYNEYNDFTSSCYQSSAMNCLGEMVERGGAYFLTVGDFLKELFSDYDEQEYEEPSSMSGYYSHFTVGGRGIVLIDPNMRYQITGTTNKHTELYYEVNVIEGSGIFYVLFTINGTYSGFQYSTHSSRKEAEEVASNLRSRYANSVSGHLDMLEQLKLTIVLSVDGENIPVTRPPSNAPSRAITNYINQNPIDVVLPRLKPTLVCGNETYDLVINGSTFFMVDGSVVALNKDGTAEVNGSICNLNWEKPTVEYDPDGNPIVTQPDGTSTDLITGDTDKKPPGSDDLEGCSGVLCGIGKLLDGLGSVVTSIADLVKDILDGLLGLFVPEDLDFVTEEFNKITKKLNDKIAITDSLKEAITSVFDGGGSNPLANISINLPITNEPLTFGNVSFIEEGVPILRRVISAIVVLYTIAYVYRKITGRGGVMER